MPGLEIIGMVSFINVNLRQIFRPITLKGLTLFTIIYFFSSIQQSAMTVTNCSSCWCFVLVTDFPQ